MTIIPVESAITARILFGVAGKASALMDSLSNWLLVGFAATATFLIEHFDAVPGGISKATLASALHALLWLVAISLVQKILALPVAGAVAGSTTAGEITEKAVREHASLDVGRILSDYRSAMIWPFSAFVSRAIRKANAGDILSPAKTMTRISQVQAYLIVIEIGIVLWQLFKLFNAVVL